MYVQFLLKTYAWLVFMNQLIFSIIITKIKMAFANVYLACTNVNETEG